MSGPILIKGIPKLAKRGWKNPVTKPPKGSKSDLIERIRNLPKKIGGKDIKRFGKGPHDVVKGTPERKAMADALREHRSSKSHKAYKKLMKKIPHDLTYMKGYLKGK